MKVPHEKKLRSSSYVAASDRWACWSSSISAGQVGTALKHPSSDSKPYQPERWWYQPSDNYSTIGVGKNNCKNDIPRLWAGFGRPLFHVVFFSWGKLHPQSHLCFIQQAASSKQLQVAAISSLVHSIPSKEPGMQQKSSAWYTPSYNLLLRPENTSKTKTYIKHIKT